MESQKPLVDRKVIVDLLYGDEDYISEFAVASVESFSEFKVQFEKSLKKRDMENLRRAGHKIKPVAQMMKLEAVITMYETSKIMLEEGAADESIKNMVAKMNEYCTQLIKELKQLQ
ncbi:taurine dioxygenase [Rhodohalobacter sp. 614A]|uniref:taurine dioxygenase n=1 Tax=Rhodohalobacter sp. 614A TaxID=2908649 RepID=UPI001F2DE221|nr:taurine dioxygenase [Rhodohalobacter sp. 614A]